MQNFRTGFTNLTIFDLAHGSRTKVLDLQAPDIQQLDLIQKRGLFSETLDNAIVEKGIRVLLLIVGKS
jgi:hypothetical protein